MKRKITSLTTAIIVLFLILFTLPETGWGQSSYTFSPSSAVFGTEAISQGGTKTYKDGDVTWTLSATEAINYLGYEGSNSARGLQFGSSSATASSFKLSTSSISGTITQIKVNAAMASSGGTKFTVWVGGTQWGSEQSVTITATAYTFTADEGDATSGTIEIRYTNSKTKASYCKSIEVSYTTGGGGGGTTYTVTYNANDGSQTPATFSHTGQQAGTYTVLANDPESNENPSFTKTGYDVSTWNESANGTGTSHAPNSTFNLTGAVTLYAIWAPHTHNVTMPTNDQFGDYSASVTENVPYGTTVTLTYDPAQGYENYTAIWTVNSETLSGNTFTMPDEDVTVEVSVKLYIKDQIDFALAATNANGYTAWNNKEGASGAIYAGKTAGNKDVSPTYIQLTNSTSGNSANSGIITTGSGGKIKKVVVTWATKQSNTNNRYLTVYGSNSAYSATSDLYSSNTYGTLLGSITYNSTNPGTTLTINGNYEFIGLLASAAVYFDKIDVYWEPYSVATPSFTPDGNSYIGTQHVIMGCATDGATIYYTTDGSLPTKDAEGTYTYVNNTTVDIATTTTLKARAYKEGEYSALKSATYTITQPFTTMQAIYDDAMTNTAEHTVYITFGNNWVISGANSSSHAFLTDGTKGCIIYASSHGFSAGDILSGTVQCKSQKYNGAVELTELTSNTSGLTVNTGGTVTVADIEMADLEAVNTGALVSYSNLTCSKETSGNYTNYYLTDGTTTVQAYKTLLDNYADYLSNGKTYDITGVFVLNNSTLRINPRTSADIVLKADMSSTDFSNLTAFSYVLNQGPSAAQHIEVYCDDLGTNTLRATAPEGYEVCLTEDGDYAAYVDMTPSQSSVAVDLYVRLAAGHNEGTYNGNLSFTATTLDAVNVPLEGSVSTVATYAIALVQTTGGTIATDMSVASEGTTVTLSYSDVDDCYNFTGWTVYKTGDQSTTEDVDENGQFEMPGYPVTATATFTQKKFTVNYSVNGTIESDLVHANITCGNNASLWDEDDLEAASVELPSGFSLVGWSTSAGSTETVDSFTPSEDATLYAVLVPTGGSSDYVKVTEDLEDWSGEYLIVYEDGLVAFDGSRDNSTGNKIDASSNTIDITDYIDNGVIASNNTTDAASFTISAITGGYSIQSASGYYIGSTSYNNELVVDANTVYANTLSIDESGNAIIKGYINNTTYTALKYNATSGQERFRYYKDTSSQQDIQLYKKQTATPYTRIYTDNTTATESITITGPTLITSGSVLNMNGQTLTCNDPANLIIEDGGQLICSNSVAATFKKTMPTPAAPSTKDEPEDVYGWELISSPVHDNNGSTIEVTNVTNLTTSTYDMFAYDEENSKWLNQKNNGGASGFSTLSNGQGYMYRNNAQELSFVGNTNVNDVEVLLTYTAGAGDLAGFHLVGNPYAENITLMNTTLYNGTTQLDNDKQLSAYYILKDNGSSWKTDLAANTPIANKQGFLIEIPSNATKIQFSRTARTAKSHGDNIKFMVANSQFEDVTYALFDKALPLNKINHRNPEVPMIYINQSDQDYAVATMTDDTKAFNLNFKAATAGKYTLSYKATGNYNYLHVIDRLTGEDIDMLLEGEYSFIGTPKDSENRFIVRLEYMPNYSEDGNGIFAYQSGSDIYVSGQGELQVFDVTGRRVMTTTINGAESISIPAQGVYIFKLNEKIQKIVVR